MEPLGSPQGAHDAATHLFSVPHRVEHAACCCCCDEGGGGVSPPLAPAAGYRVAEVVLAGEQTMGGGFHSNLCSPPSIFLFRLFLTYTHKEAAEELTEEVMEVTRC